MSENVDDVVPPAIKKPKLAAARVADDDDVVCLGSSDEVLIVAAKSPHPSSDETKPHPSSMASCEMKPHLSTEEAKPHSEVTKPFVGSEENSVATTHPLFFLTRVRGIAERYNAPTMAKGIKGEFMNEALHIIIHPSDI